MAQTFFTIVVPAYNRAPFLREIVRSAQAQTFEDFEMIVVDDGSTDNTRETVQLLQEKDHRIRYLFQENKERGAARNNGFLHAAGQYVLFIDSDDVMLPNYLADLKKLIEQVPEYNFYGARYDFRHGNKLVRSDIYKLAAGEHSGEVMLKGNPFACNFCVKKDNPNVILFNEDRNLATTEDWMFMVENLHKDKIYVGGFKGVEMVQHDGRSMQQNQMIIERRIAATKVLENKVPFNKQALNTLWAYTWSFCATHAYLDFNKAQSLMLIRKAINLKKTIRFLGNNM